MYKNAFLLLKNCKNRPALTPRPPTSGSEGFATRPLRPQPNTPLKIPGYATELRPYELEGGRLRQGEDFAYNERGSMFRDFVWTSFMEGSLFTFLVAVCVANIPASMQGRRQQNFQGGGQWKSQDREIAPISRSPFISGG